jgi:hypothetical protein
MSTPGHPLDFFPSRCYAERIAGEGRPLATAIAAVLNAISAVLGTAPLSWYVGAEGTKPFPVRIDETGMQDLLAQTLGRRDEVVPFSVADHPTEWNLFLALQVSPIEGIEYIDLSFPGAREQQPASLAGIMNLVEAVSAAFGAHTAYIEDAALQNLYVGRRVVEIVRAKVPPALRDRVGDYQPVPGAAGTLPELLLPSEFDRSRVPHAVYWVNYWSARQIDALGRERVERAPWERIASADNATFTLAATAAPPDITDPHDLERLRRLVEHLDLRAAQERYR